MFQAHSALPQSCLGYFVSKSDSAHEADAPAPLEVFSVNTFPSTMIVHVIAPSSSNPLLAVAVAIFTSPVTVTSLVHGHFCFFFSGGYC